MPEPCSNVCPHCGTVLAPLQLPEALFEHAHDLACFNDHCPYYVRGWTWMEHHYGVRSSYRYRVDAKTGQASPIAAWAMHSPRITSDEALAADAKERP